MIFTAGLSNLAARSRSHRNQHLDTPGPGPKLSKSIVIALSLSSSLLIQVSKGTFVLLALERFFRLALIMMVIDFERPSNKPDLT